jgi:hypothetical protein
MAFVFNKPVLLAPDLALGLELMDPMAAPIATADSAVPAASSRRSSWSWLTRLLPR